MLEGVDFERIDEEQRCNLERPFVEDEVKATLSSLEDDKAPGLDGFPLKFLKVCWDVVEREVMTVFEALHVRDQWCKFLSAIFITLISKKEGAVHIKDFWPISLVGCFYKLVAKVLAIRLKGCIFLGDLCLVECFYSR